MKKKYLFGGFIIVVFLGLTAYLFTQSNIKYESNLSVVMAKDKTVKATGKWVKDKNYVINTSDRTFSFYMMDNHGTEMKVIYNGTIPNNFETAQSVVVTGKYYDNCFHATSILTKCPSKYEGQNVQAVKTSTL